MRRNFLATALITASLIVGSVAYADESADRALQKAKWTPIFEQQRADLNALKLKAKVDPSFLKKVNGVIADFEQNIGTLNAGWDSQDLQSLVAFAEEESGEFANSIDLLKKMAAKIKTITCVKGKTSKKVTAVNPICPAGYKKR